MRIDLLAKLDSARIALQVDIGFGDAVTPAPVVAKKFHAVCLLGMTNTRMKDYFDLWVLLGENTLHPWELRRAIETTFERRKMAITSHCMGRPR